MEEEEEETVGKKDYHPKCVCTNCGMSPSRCLTLSVSHPIYTEKPFSALYNVLFTVHSVPYIVDSVHFRVCSVQCTL